MTPRASSARALRSLTDGQLALLLLAAGVFVYLLSARGQETVFDYFGRLAVALTHGEWWLDDAPSHLNELVTGVGGHRYSVVQPLPALLLVPLVPFGHPGEIQTFLSAVAGGATGAPMFLIGRRLGAPRSVAVTVALLSLFGTELWITAVDGRSWWAADTIGALVLTLAVWAALAGAPPLVVGLALGAATLTRGPMILAAPALFLLLPGRPSVRRALAIAGGIAPFIALEAAYNVARWGTPLEIGYALLSADDPLYSRGIFSLSYVPRHIYAMFLEPPAFVDNTLTFLRARFIGMSLLVVTPALVWIARTPFLVRSGGMWIAFLALGLITLAPDMLFGTVGFEQYGYRRALDAHPFLMALTAVGAAWTGRGWRPRAGALFLVVVAVSIALNLYFLVTIRVYGMAR